MPEMDLERLAAAYHHRSVEEASRKAAAAAEAAGLAEGSLALDIGGGRGEHAAHFASRGASAVVVDPSRAMCRVASKRVSAIRARGEALPVAGAVADLAYFHMSIHHGAWRRMLSEAVRVLRADGLAWVWTLTREHHRRSFLARWFPSVGRIDEWRFPDPDGLVRALIGLGCRDVSRVDSVTPIERRAGEWARAVEAGFVSTLQLVPPEELAAGLEWFRREHPDPDERLSYELQHARVSGRAP